MDRDTIIRLAEEAGLEPRLWNHTDAFERFAALVAAQTKEECAKVCDEIDRRWINQADKCVEAIRNMK